MTKHTCEYCKYCKQCSSLEKRLTKKGELCYDFEEDEKTMTKKEQIDKIDELQKQVDELIEERENMQSEIIATEEARLQAIKGTAKEIYTQVLEWLPVCEDYHWFITTLENWLKEKYGVEVE